MAPSNTSENVHLSKEWLEKMLNKGTGTFKIRDISSTELSFQGMLSQLFAVKLQWETQGSPLPSNVVVKLPKEAQFGEAFINMEGENPLKKEWEQADLPQFPVTACHNCECAVYEQFSRNPPDGVKIPKCYYSCPMSQEKQGVLVLEDLSEGIGTTIAEGLSRDQLMEVVETVASLHAYSINNRDWLNNNDINVNWSIFDNPSFPSPAKMAQLAIPQFKADNPELIGQSVIDTVLEMCKSMDDITYIYRLNKELGLIDVLCHGDVHAQNMIFMKDKPNKLLGLLDWQIAHPGNIGEDLARCFASSLSAEIRRADTHLALAHYYRCLEARLAKTPPFSVDQLIESYKLCFKYGALAIMPIFAILPDQKGFLGENAEEKKKELNQRCKALLEDIVKYENDISS